MSNRFSHTRARLIGSAAVLALSAGAAMAQEGVEQVVVSSTRLQAAGFDAPTPTTVISSADLEAQAKPNVFDSLKDLPALQGSTGAAAQAGTTSNGLIGLSALGLRGLSPLRTLVLIDGQRHVAANLNGTVDVSQMPQMLIQRVDVVTGGASASWGSDAVAGVINFVTDKKFEGFKGHLETGLSGYGDMGNVTVQLAAGSSFWGGRGHFEVAGEYSYNDGLLPRYPQAQQHTALPGNIGGRNLSRQSGQAGYPANGLSTPAGYPITYYGPLKQQIQYAAYGLIPSGPKAGTTFNQYGQAVQYSLAGNCFVGPNAAGVIGIQGSINGQGCFGTPSKPGDQVDSHEFTQGLINPLTRGNIYARVSYDLTPSTEIYATMSYGGVRTENTPAQGNSDKQVNLHCDNAYLPSTNLFGANLSNADTQAACMASLNGPGSGKTAAQIAAATPANTTLVLGSNYGAILTDQNMHIFRQTRRFVVGGDGTFDLFGKNWSWDSYFEHGESDTSIKIANMPLSNGPVNPATGVGIVGDLARFNLAQDAVVGAGGVTVCRNTIAQQFGCQPFNPFGGGAASPGAVAYFDNQNTQGGQTNGISVIQTNRQEAFSFAVNGAPIEDWAGPVAVAFGYEYREEHFSQRADPYASGISASTPATFTEPCTDPFVDCGLTTYSDPSAGSTIRNGLGAYNAGNYHNGRGTYHVNEVFVDLGIPLLNDQFWGKMDLEVAGRHARYSEPGSTLAKGAGVDANTWKVGITWDTPIPGIRLRALQSRDIRAPNLSELAPPPVGANGSFNNDVTGTQNQNIISVTAGNNLLKPERSQTTEVGIVWQPDFIPGFQASVDYYRIGISKVIFALGQQSIEDLCIQQSQAAFCNPQTFILTSNGLPQSATNPGAAGTPSAIFQIRVFPLNAASLVTDGVDFEASYQFDLQDYDVPGTFVLRTLVNHTSKYILNTGIPGAQQNSELTGNVNAGNNGQTYTQFGGTILNWKAQETQSYQNDDWGFILTERWLGPGVTTNRNSIVCAVGNCPSNIVGTPTYSASFNPVQTPTINYNHVDSMFYLDVGFNWNISPKTSLYTKVDNVTNIRPPDIGQQDNNQVIYDVIGRMFHVGVRFNY